MINPWTELPNETPYVLASDLASTEAFNKKCSDSPQFILQTQILPEPFVGNKESPVYVLNLNPGYDTQDDHWHSKPDFHLALRNNLAHKEAEYPFYFLDPAFQDSPGSRWWNAKCKWLINEFGGPFISRNVFCVELFPYHSKNYKPMPTAISKNALVPSSDYSAYLVKQAILDNKAIIVTRAFSAWCRQVPELAHYKNLFRIRNPQNVTLSPGNIDEYQKIVSILKAF